MATHNLPDHFASFFRRLNPGQSFEATASSQYATIKGLLEDRSGAAASLAPVCFLQGSYRQQTAIYSINDVDMVALCKLWQGPGTGTGGRTYTRDEIFEIIAAPLKNDGRYRTKVRFGAESMCVKVDLGIKVEILPVVFKIGTNDQAVEPFRLYRPATAQWEDGFARYHQKRLSAKNSQERTGCNFIPAVKVFKHLRSRNNLNAVSFHIECLLYVLDDPFFVGQPCDYIPALLNKIASVTTENCYKTVVKTPCGDRDIFTASEWSAADWWDFHARLQEWARLATSARDAQGKGEAIKYWRALLGDDYFPESV
jgi:hypothetical protein